MRGLLHAARTLRKTPGFVLVAVCSLAIGIGANSAVYSFAKALLLRPLAVRQPSQVVTITQVSSGMFGAQAGISYPNFVDLRDRNHTFQGLVGMSNAEFGYAPDRQTQARMKFGMFVSGDFFQVLGVQPALGRAFRPEEYNAPGRAAVTVLSYELWTSDFRGDPAVIGRNIRLSGTEFTVIGVTPEWFRGVEQVKPALYVPITMAATIWSPEMLSERGQRWLDVKGRLKPGVSLAQAQGDLETLVAVLRRTHPTTDGSLKVKAQTEFRFHVEQSPPDTALAAMLALLATCVLIVACANVAGLLLTRATARAREIAVRLAVGAGRGALVRQLLTESLLLSLGGAVLSLVIAYGADAFFNTLPMPTDIPVNLHANVDRGVFLFTLIVAVASTLLFGLVPSMKASKPDLVSALKEKDGGTGVQGTRPWGRNAIVAGQIALSLVLLVVAGVLTEGFAKQLSQGPGFRTDHLQLIDFDPGLIHYSDAQRDLFYKQLLDQTKLLPGVRSAVLSSGVPMNPGGIDSTDVLPEGPQLKQGEPAPNVFDAIITPGYIQTMAIPIVEGRSFEETDQANTAQVAIVNEQMARHYWPKQNPLGERIHIGGAGGKLVEVVGVAKSSKYLWITEGPTDFLYLPYAQNPRGNMFLVAESKSSDPVALLPALRGVVRRLDPNMPIFDVRTMKDFYRSRAVKTPSMIFEMFGALGLMSLVLAIIGLYGVMSYSVSRRVREFGIRMAVGADRRSVIALVLCRSFALGVIGIGVGSLLGLFAVRAVMSLPLFSFPSAGMLPFAAVSVLLLVTTAFAAFIPARRASRVDPMRALRDE